MTDKQIEKLFTVLVDCSNQIAEKLDDLVSAVKGASEDVESVLRNIEYDINGTKKILAKELDIISGTIDHLRIKSSVTSDSLDSIHNRLQDFLECDTPQVAPLERIANCLEKLTSEDFKELT